MPVSGSGNITPYTRQTCTFPVPLPDNLATAMGSVIHTRNTSQSLTTFSFASAASAPPPLPLRACSAPAIHQPEYAQLTGFSAEVLPELQAPGAMARCESLLALQHSDITPLTGSPLPHDNAASWQATVAASSAQPGAQRHPRPRPSRQPQQPPHSSRNRTPPSPADTSALTASGHYFADIKFDILYHSTASAAEKRRELSKLCTSASAGRRIDLSGVNLQNVDLSGLNMQGFILDGANFSGSTMNNTRLQGASLIGAILRDATLHETRLSQADLTFASLESARMITAEMQEVKLRGARLPGAQLPADITLKLPDDYCRQGVPDSGYFQQLTEAVYSLGKPARKTRQRLYNQLWSSLEKCGDEAFQQTHRSMLIETEVRDAEHRPGGDGKGNLFQIAWDIIKP